MDQKIFSHSNINRAHHTAIQSLLWHILPGALTTIAFFLLRPVTTFFNYPPLFAFLLSVLLVDLPFMVGVMLYEGRRKNGRFSLSGFISYQEKLPLTRFILLFLLSFAIVFIIITLVTPINNYLADTIFSSLPKWLFMDEQSQYNEFSRQILLITFGLHLILTGLILPWIEELYFRGYLLPHLADYGKFAPILGGFYFALYHIWQPQGFLTVFLLGMALSYIAWRFRDINLPIALHVFANIMTRLPIFMTILALPANA